MKNRSIRDGLTMLGIMLILSGFIVLLVSYGDIFSAFVPASLIKNSSEPLSSETISDSGLTMDNPLESWPEESFSPSSQTAHQSSALISSALSSNGAVSSQPSSIASSQKSSQVSSKSISSHVSGSKPSSAASGVTSQTSSTASSSIASSAASSLPVSSSASSVPPASSSQSSTVVSSMDTSSPSSSSQVSSVPSDPLAKTVTLTANGQTSTMTYAEALKGMVGKEVSATFQDEAIKAQIVACYTFLRYYADRGQVPTVVFATPSNLNIQWGNNGVARLERLIQEVGGKLMTINGKPIMSTFYAMSTGKTNNAEDVWNNTKDAFGNDLSYLVSVDSPWDTTASNFISTLTLTSAQLKTYVQSALGIVLSGDPSEWLRINTRNSAGYVLSMSVGGTETTGRVFRENVIGGTLLKSAAFDFTYSAAADSFTFTAKGFGHGVGMSQIGANGMAKEGATWQEILKHYYIGVTIE